MVNRAAVAMRSTAIVLSDMGCPNPMHEGASGWGGLHVSGLAALASLEMKGDWRELSEGKMKDFLRNYLIMMISAVVVAFIIAAVVAILLG